MTKRTNRRGEELTQVKVWLPTKTRDAIARSAKENSMSLTEYVCTCCASSSAAADTTGFKRRAMRAIYRGVTEIDSLRASTEGAEYEAYTRAKSVLGDVRKALMDPDEVS